ncbi:MAG TPA: hypothetical protein DDY59_08160, partial [Lachnospiraceae bacterium]|nr:hypothetical protein [Lachnospiraceae bacterium]
VVIKIASNYIEKAKDPFINVPSFFTKIFKFLSIVFNIFPSLLNWLLIYPLKYPHKITPQQSPDLLIYGIISQINQYVNTCKKIVRF